MVNISRWSAALLLSMAVVAGAMAGGMENGKTVEIVIKEFTFTPDHLTVTPGTTVRWVNREKRQYHSVWFEELGEPEPDYIFPEESYQRTFSESGSFPYRCGPHPEMRGRIEVTE